MGIGNYVNKDLNLGCRFLGMKEVFKMEVEIGDERLNVGSGLHGILDGKLLWTGGGSIEAWESYDKYYPWYYEFDEERWTSARIG